MKKFLSLVLSLVMTMSLVTIGAGATEYKDFADKGEVQYEEAVAVLNKIGIITGYEDGSFRPEGALTRGAAAKIIVSLMIGSDAASSLAVAAAPYSDVPVTNTFAAVISYCKTAGYINGYADGTFRPTGALTGYAFAKMLLGALGYDGAIEGFTGSGWTMNVAKIGNLAGLYKGLSGFSGNAGINRETACALALNTLKADEVHYTGNNINVTSGGATVSITDSKYSYVPNATANDYRVSAGVTTDDRMQFVEEHFADLKITSLTIPDDFGRPATTWQYKKNNVGTFATIADQIATYEGKVTLATMYSLLGSSTIADLDSVALGTGTLAFWTDGVAAVSPSAAANAVKNSSAAAFGTGKGAVTEVYKDSAGNVTVVVMNTYLVQAAAGYNTSKENVTIVTKSQNPATVIPTTISNDDFDVTNVKADDYLLVTVAAGTIKTVKAAETVTGNVSAYVDGDSVTVAGTKYGYSSKATAETKATSYSAGKDATVVLDAQGNVIFVDEATVSSKDFVFVSKFASPNGLGTSAVAQAYFADGTDAAIDVKKVDAETNAGLIAAYAINPTYTHWYTYSKDSNDKYTLTSPAGYTVATSALAVTNATVNFTGTINGNSSTVFVVLNKDNEVDLYTGIANVPTVTGGTIATTAAVKDGYAKYVFINASAATTITEASVDNSNTLYILEAAKTAKDGDGTYYTYVALVNGEKQTIESTVNTFAVGSLYYNVRMNSAGTRYTGGSQITVGATGQYQYSASGSQYVVSHSSGVFTVDNQPLVINDSTNIVVVTLKAAAGLNKDANADYEVNSYVGTSGAEAVEAYLSGNRVNASVSAINTTSTSGVVETLYITVSSAATLYSVAAPTISGVTGAGYAAGDFTVTADKTAGIDNETVTLTITYTGSVDTGDDDVIAITITAADADGIVDPSGATLTGLDSNKSWTGTLDINAKNVGSISVAIAVTVN